MMTIPLSDVLGADEEVSAASANGGGGIAAPSVVGGGNGRGACHRIFLRTSSHGYVEFSPENSNSHDVFMAFLKAHLPPERMPRKRGEGGDWGGGGRPSSERHRPQPPQQQQRAASPRVGMLRTMVLTPTKEVPGAPSGCGGPTPSAAVPRARSLPQGDRSDRSTIKMSLSAISSRSNTIDKLQSKVIQQRLRDESTPLSRAKDAASAWMSSILDCGLCCMDTTTVAPLDASSSAGGGGDGVGVATRRVDSDSDARPTIGGGVKTTPNGEALRNLGIGGLSFEIDSASSSPKMGCI